MLPGMSQEELIQLAETLDRELAGKEPSEVIRHVWEQFGKRAAFATSLGAEDQVITAMIAAVDLRFPIFTLDTGRMFQETYDLFDVTVNRYKVPIQVYFPDSRKVEEMVSSKGINLFYESIENRKLCCNIRKVEPLRRALENRDLWLSGLRREQTLTRQDGRLIEWDELNRKIKVNPLIGWTQEEVWQFIRRENVPYNPLHDKGYPSIGCLPCTRAVQPGEDFRAGRWWWEQPEQRECGLHK